MLNIAIIGFGKIGSGVADVFAENESVISKKLGDTVNIKYILDIREIKNHPLSDRCIRDFNIILNDPDISLIVETIAETVPGSTLEAYKFTKSALEKGVNVVTSNKAVVAKFGAELLKIAAETNARYFFEASVGGGIPIIRPIYNCLAANKLNKITAILNGTTNFILTKMSNEGLDFDAALEIAQENGFAERDPSADIDGIDSCRKICILSSLAFGRQLPPEKVYAEGIRYITPDDIKNAEKIGCRIKLIAKAEKIENPDAVYVIVAPMLVPRNSPLYNIEDVFNGIVVTGNVIGDVMFYGQGAGKLPTASAVAADVMDALLKSTKNMMWEVSDGSYVSDYKKYPAKYYIRAEVDPNVLKPDDLNSIYYLIGKTFPDADIYESNNSKELFFTVHISDDYKFDDGIKNLSDAGFKIKSKIRIL
ncbi:MAG: homoserine dehydrogenase [Oscillospiraceae bacterium]|nr:homoserine dehydrogenase [Oscillospiraceae bacterium]